MRKNVSGFTIVELLIVIVVIAILAAITVVAFRGIQERARDSTLQADLSNALKKVMLEAADAPSKLTSLPATIKTSNGNILSLTSTEGNEYCINGYGQDNKVSSISSQKGINNYLCNGAITGTPIGGSVPAVPTDANLVAGFSGWTLSGGVTYNSSTDQICVSPTDGVATSPLIRVEGSASAQLTIEARATQPHPTHTPDSRGLYGSSYYDQSGTTLVQNSSNYTGNGNAQALPVSTWTTHIWGTPTGPNVKYVRFNVTSAPSTYTSNNCYRNPQVVITK